MVTTGSILRLSLVIYYGALSVVSAFTPLRNQLTTPRLLNQKSTPTTPFTSSPRLPKTTWQLYEESDPVDEMSEERKANLFQNLLRDLQIEGVPLLGCDADQVHTLSAALWTTMSEMSDSDDAQRACLILESIPMSALRAFAEDFSVLKTQSRLMTHLPELERISISIVGKGSGPGVLIETTTRTEEEKAEKSARKANEEGLHEEKCLTAMKSFVDRVVIKLDACPYTRTPDWSATGLENKGVVAAPVAYRYSGSSDACAAIGAFWNSVCELIGTPDDEISTTILSLPAIGAGKSEEAHSRFAAVTEIIGRYLCLFRGDGMFGLVHFHPAYNRNEIMPPMAAAYGQLPPQSWLRPMLRMRNLDEADTFTDEQLSNSNYQRRSPHTAINILRVSHLNAASGPKSVVDLDLGDGRTEKASGINTYTRNALRLGNMDTATLEAALDVEIDMQQ